MKQNKHHKPAEREPSSISSSSSTFGVQFHGPLNALLASNTLPATWKSLRPSPDTRRGETHYQFPAAVDSHMAVDRASRGTWWFASARCELLRARKTKNLKRAKWSTAKPNGFEAEMFRRVTCELGSLGLLTHNCR